MFTEEFWNGTTVSIIICSSVNEVCCDHDPPLTIVNYGHKISARNDKQQ